MDRECIMTDTELISAVLHGQTTLFEQLIDRYLPMVRGVCASRFRDPATVDDLTQDAFITGYRNLDKLRNPARFGPWLATIARNTCTTHLRSVSRRAATVERAGREANGTPETPEEIVQRRELYAWVHRAIAKLPEKTREAMVLHYVEGLSTMEVAQQTGIREPAVRKRLQYGRQLVGETLWKELEPHRAAARPDTEKAKRRVLKALPLAAAPWLINGGKAAASTGVLTALGSGGLMKLGLGVALVIAAAVTWHVARDRTSTTNADALVVTQADIPVHEPVASTPSSAEPAEAPPASPNGSGGSGTLTVQVNLERKDPYPTERTESGAVVKQLVYQRPADSGQPVPHAAVRVIPMRIEAATLRNRFAQTHVDPGLADRVVQALQAIFDLKFGLMTSGPPSEADRSRDEAIVAKLGISEAEMRDAMNQLYQVLNDSENSDMSPMAMLFSPAPQSQWLESTTDERGKATFTTVPPGRCFVAARDPEVVHEWPTPDEDIASTLEAMNRTGMGMLETGVLADGEKSTTVLIADERSRFSGTVVDESTGEPIENARIEVVSLDIPGEEDNTHTNSEGQYWLTPNRVGYGTLHVRVEADNYQPVEFSQERMLGVQTEPQTIELTQKILICGTVTTFDGKPAAGVRILRWSGDSGQSAATSAEDGTFCLGHDGGQTTLSASVGPLYTDKVTLDLAPDETGEVDFALPPSGAIQLNVTTASGDPVTRLEDVNIFRWASGKRTNRDSDLGVELSSSNGEYKLYYIEPGEYRVDARAEGLEALVLDRISVAAGQTAGPYYVRLDPARADLTVRLENASGEPQSSYYFSLHRIMAWSDDQGSRGRQFDRIANERTDGSGEYAFEGLAPGQYRVDRGTYGTEVDVPYAGVFVVREEKRIAKEPSKPALYLGVAPYRMEDGKRIPVHGSGAKIYVIPLVTPETNDLQLHLMDGTAVYTPGPYLMAYVLPGATVGLKHVDVVAADFETYKQKQLLIELEIQEGGSIEGAVVDKDGSPVSDHEVGVLPVQLWDVAQTSSDITQWQWQQFARNIAQGVQTDATGAFTIDHLPTGAYVIGVSPDAMSEPIEVVAGNVTSPVVIVESE